MSLMRLRVAEKGSDKKRKDKCERYVARPVLHYFDNAPMSHKSLVPRVQYTMFLHNKQLLCFSYTL